MDACIKQQSIDVGEQRIKEVNTQTFLLLLVEALAAAHPAFRFRAVKQRQNPSGYIVDTMQAVLQSFFDTDDFRSCLIDVVNRGGDADTTGAIAGMLAGTLYGLEEIPEQWLIGIRDGQTMQGTGAGTMQLGKLTIRPVRSGGRQL